MLRRTLLALRETSATRQTAPGQYDKSFEKVVERIERTLPRNRMSEELKGLGQVEKDKFYGDTPFEEDKKKQQDAYWGKEGTSPGDRKAKQIFDAEDWEQRIRETHERTKRLRSEQTKSDPMLLKSSKESPEYYYPQLTLEEKVARRRRFLLLWGIAGGTALITSIRTVNGALSDYNDSVSRGGGGGYTA